MYFIKDYDRINSNSPPNRATTHRINPFLKDMPKTLSNNKTDEINPPSTQHSEHLKLNANKSANSLLPKDVVGSNILPIMDEEIRQHHTDVTENEFNADGVPGVDADSNEDIQNEHEDLEKMLNNNSRTPSIQNSNSSSLLTDNQNGNECIEGTGVVKTSVSTGKVVRRKKTPPQAGMNGNDSMSSSYTNTTTINNNRTNIMHRASLAKMEGLMNSSNDNLNISSMSASMEMDGKIFRGTRRNP